MSAKTRLEKVTELQQIETRRDQFREQLKAVSSSYFIRGTVGFTTETRDFNDKGEDNDVQFDPKLMKAYLQSEIDKLTDASNEIVKDLAEG